MHIEVRARSPRIERPGFTWIAVILELGTGLLAIPVGISFLSDPTGSGVGIPQGWIEATPFGDYVIPGIYLLVMNGAGMLAAAGLTVLRRPVAPWLTAMLGVGLVLWILVQIVVMPETMVLTWVFLATGFALAAIGAAWLHRTDQLRLRLR